MHGTGRVKKDKKGSNNQTSNYSNYRPVSILPNVSKTFEMYIYMTIILINFFSKYLFGFRKGFSVQQCLVALIELWKPNVDKKHYAFNNRDDLLHLSFTLKISIFSGAYI